MAYVDHFIEKIVGTLQHRVKYRQGDSICVYAAEQNVISVMTAVTSFVAENEQWGPTDCTTYSAFNLAKERLYLMHSILIEVNQKPMSHPDWSHMQLDVSGYATLFYDLELNVSDPYFNEIKRDYYNDVSN